MNNNEEQNRTNLVENISFEWIYNKYQQRLIQFVVRIMNSNVFAEDIVQDVFIGLLQQEIYFISESSIVSYIYRSVYNKCIDKIRRKQMAQQYEEAYYNKYKSLSDNTNSELNLKELTSIVEKRIDNLPPKCRMIFSMKYRSEQSNPEISEQLGLSIKTVENQVFIARSTLRNYLQAYLCS